MVKFFKNIFDTIFQRKPLVTVIKMNGVIGTSGFGRSRINYESLESIINKAFGEKRAKAVSIIINSPGGSPVQSSLIFKRIRYLADKKDIPVLVFVEDVAASGGYWLACAGDEIYADQSSIIGSIGVISASFGFSEAIKKIGVERRVYSTGKAKGSLDPFKPENPNDIKMLKNIQNDIQKAFIDLVTLRRGKRLTNEIDLFTGAFWSGTEALKLGLIDGIGETREILRKRFGENVKIKIITKRKGFLSNITQSRNQNIINGLISSIEENEIWRRFGL